jgi:hypothetical protein
LGWPKASALLVMVSVSPHGSIVLRHVDDGEAANPALLGFTRSIIAGVATAA